MKNGGLRYLLVDDYCTVADNFDAILAWQYKLYGSAYYMPFEKELKIGHQVREV